MDNQKFIEKSKRERYALQQIENILRQGKESMVYYTDIFKHDIYDALYQFTIDGTPKKTWIIEAKIRTKEYDTMQLEIKKYKDLKNKILTDYTDIIYVNFLPTGSYIWNLTKLSLSNPEIFNHIEYKMCPKSTVGDTTKINKPSYYLPKSLAKRIDFIYSEQEYLKSNNVMDINAKNKRQFCLFKDVFDIQDK